VRCVEKEQAYFRQTDEQFAEQNVGEFRTVSASSTCHRRLTRQLHPTTDKETRNVAAQLKKNNGRPWTLTSLDSLVDRHMHTAQLGISICYSALLTSLSSHQDTVSSSELVIPLSRLVTVGDRSFDVAGSRLRNTLPEDITSAST